MAGCGCGGEGPKKRGPAARGFAEPEIWPGELGFMPLAYVGKAPTPRVWRGQFTGACYTFGGDQIRKLVDRRDGLKFLTIPGDEVVFAYDCSESYQTEKAQRQGDAADPAQCHEEGWDADQEGL